MNALTQHAANSDSLGPTPRELVDQLVLLLELEKVETGLFRGIRTEEPWIRVYGGQVVGQALMAACRTVASSRLPHSLHAYFLRPGDATLPIVYQVYEDRDGGSFSSRRVVAIQNGEHILNLAASFHESEKGFEHQLPMPETEGPDSLKSEIELALEHIDAIADIRRPVALRSRPIEFRPIGYDGRFSRAALPARQGHWFRAVDSLPDDQTLHRVILAYASDMMLLSTSTLPHGVSWTQNNVQQASIDHALWIHRDVKMDDWLLYLQDSPWAGGARGLTRGLIYTRNGDLIASVAQEGLIRPMRT